MPGYLQWKHWHRLGRLPFYQKKKTKGKIAYFGGIQKCKFKGKVVPGDKLKLETRMIKQKGPSAIGEAVASVNGKVVVSAELTFMIG